jgi:anti-sigma factor RsiW
MDTCDRIRKKLSAYQDGELENDSKETIESHLRKCKGCRRYYAALQRTYQALKRLPDIEADERLFLRILDRVVISRKSPWIVVQDSVSHLLPSPAAIAAVGIAGILIGLLGGHFWVEQQFPAPQSLSTTLSASALTIASVKAFDAVPSGSFAEGYLKLTTYSPEIRHAK